MSIGSQSRVINKASILKAFFIFFLFVLLTKPAIGQTLPYTLTNNSAFADDQIYVAIVGITDGHVWIDAETGAVNPMQISDNTIPGPVIDGNLGPGGNGLYADCFTRLSDIPGKTLNIPKIAGCRILISFQSQLYLYFFGSTGSPCGYAAPNLANPTDPNQGIRFEMIELTYNHAGLWCNSSRVDSYQYPLGLEVWGNDFYKKVGEVKTHDEILAQWQATAPYEFQSLLNPSEGIIHFPTKTSTFPTDFFQSYIDAIWSKYSREQLVFNSGQAGVWRGRVQANQFVLTRDRDGQVGIIPGKPTTLEAMEGSGVLASGGQWDKVVQAQFVAAITRHAIDLNAASGILQDFGDTSAYYQTWPYNWYAKFWHRPDISFQGQTYAFAYDDVFDQSATIHTPNPTSIKITVGGFAGADTPEGVSGLGGTYVIENRKSGLVMDVASGGAANGTNILQWHNTGAANQQFTLNEVSPGVYAMLNVQTGKCVDIAGIGNQNFANVYQWDYVGGANQQFRAESVGAGYYKFRAMHSHKIIEVGYARLEAGANINQYDDHGQVCGQWRLLPAGASSWSTSIEAESFSSMHNVAVENTSDLGGGQNVGWIEHGSWMAYRHINIPTSGNYLVEYRIASQNGGGQLSLDANAGTTVFGVIDIPQTGGWQIWQTIAHSVYIEAGTHDFGIYAASGGWNINWWKITQQ